MNRGWTVIETAIVLALVCIVGAIVLGAVYEYHHPCIRSHVEHNRIIGYNQVQVGDSTVAFPIYGDLTVCDERTTRVEADP